MDVCGCVPAACKGLIVRMPVCLCACCVRVRAYACVCLYACVPAACNMPVCLRHVRARACVPAVGRERVCALVPAACQGLVVDPDHLAVAAGAGAIINDLFHCITSAVSHA